MLQTKKYKNFFLVRKLARLTKAPFIKHTTSFYSKNWLLKSLFSIRC